MVDVAFAIDAEAIPAVMQSRMPDAYDADGLVVPGAALPPVDILIVKQPLSSRDLASLQKAFDLPEGIVREYAYKIWSRYELKPEQIVVSDGEELEVVYVFPRPADGFTKAVMGLKKHN